MEGPVIKKYRGVKWTKGETKGKANFEDTMRVIRKVDHRQHGR